MWEFIGKFWLETLFGLIVAGLTAGVTRINKKLKEELGEYKKMFEDHLKECYIKNTAEFLDKKFPAIN